MAERSARKQLAVIQARHDKDWSRGSGGREAGPCRDMGIIRRSKCHGLAAAWMTGSGGEGGVESDFWFWGQCAGANRGGGRGQKERGDSV